MLNPPRMLRLALVCAGFLSSSAAVQATEIKVMNSGGFAPAYRAVLPDFEKRTGDKVETAWGPSMGKAADAIPNRLARGEKADVLIMVGDALDALIKAGKVRADSRVALADSRIGMVVRKGAPKPDISTPEALRAALLQARSIAYSDSASGKYVGGPLFRRLNVEQQVRDKAHMIQQTPVAEVVAAGQYEIGFQQVSELLPIAGAEFVGRIPDSLQQVTQFAAGIPVDAPHPEAGRELIRFLASPAAAPAVARSGMDPVAHAAR